MNLALALQYVVIVLAVVVSTWVVANKQFPNVMRRLRISLALPMVRDGRPGWMRGLGRRIAPVASSNAGACGGCSSCGPSPPATRK